jgi:crotonobetainyl-CoA:carnitine CoA-transferase CaiB-like acyl-CoA transferase
MNYLASGVAPGRMGNAHPNIVPYQDFPTLDGDMIIAVGNDAQFARLCGALDHPEWAAMEQFASNSARVANREHCIALLSGATRLRATADWVARLEAVGVPCGPINDLAQVFADPQVIARGMRMSLPHGSGAEVNLVANPARMSETPPTYRSAPPLLGEHTRAVLARLLELDDAAIDRLAADRTI